jgi:predicted PurR-regulated permease PerM
MKRTDGPSDGEADAPADPRPLATDMAAPPARVEPVVVPRWVQMVALPLAVLGLWALARAAGVVLLLFLVAGVVALVLNPLVKLLQRARIPHGLAVLCVYLAFFVTLAGAGVMLADPVGDQVAGFQENVPELIDSANASLEGMQRWLDERGIGIEVKAQGETALETLRGDVVESSGDIVAATREVLTVLVEASFALVLVLVISIYMLIYGPQIGALARRLMPPGDGTPYDDYPIRVQKAVSGYVRGQLLFSLIMGTSAGLGLWLFGLLGIFPEGRTYAFFFGLFFGLMELIPYIGPWLGATPPTIVALFNDPLTAVWLALFFVALQQLEGHVVAPLVFGHSLRINPLLVILALLVGGQLYGVVGALVALPIAAVARETAVYLRGHLVLEPWGMPTPALAGAGVRAARPPPGSGPCPGCGATAATGDAYCRACGSELRTEVAGPP